MRGAAVAPWFHRAVRTRPRRAPIRRRGRGRGAQNGSCMPRASSRLPGADRAFNRPAASRDLRCARAFRGTASAWPRGSTLHGTRTSQGALGGVAAPRCPCRSRRPPSTTRMTGTGSASTGPALTGPAGPRRPARPVARRRARAGGRVASWTVLAGLPMPELAAQAIGTQAIAFRQPDRQCGQLLAPAPRTGIGRSRSACEFGAASLAAEPTERDDNRHDNASRVTENPPSDLSEFIAS